MKNITLEILSFQDPIMNRSVRSWPGRHGSISIAHIPVSTNSRLDQPR